MAKATPVYHGEKDVGKVIAKFFVYDGEVEEALVVAGDTSNIVWFCKKRGGRYIVHQKEWTDIGYGPSSKTLANWSTGTSDKRKAIKSMINSIVRPYVSPNLKKFAFPVDAEILRKSLETALLT